MTVQGISPGEVYVINTDFSGDLEPESNTIMNGQAKLGLAYMEPKYSIELDLDLQLYSNTNFSISKKANTAIYRSDTDTYAELSSPVESASSDPHPLLLTVIPALGFQYNFGTTRLGIGARYERSYEQDDSGVDVLLLTAGFTNTFKNYLGSFAFVYTDAKDAGGNTKMNDEGYEEKANFSYKQLGLILSGSYYF